MKTSHLYLAAAAVAALAIFAARRASSTPRAVRTSWTPERQAQFRDRLWREVEPEFWI